VINKVITLGALFVGLFSAYGRDVFELESRYLGDGWFEYRFRTLEDPFFTRIDLVQLAVFPFTNYVESVAPPHWTNAINGAEWNGVRFDRSMVQPRINEVVFSGRSARLHFRQSTNAFVSLFGLSVADVYSFLNGAAGYARMPCLIPCSPEEADGSSPIFVSRVEMIRDIKIDQLIRTNDHVYGLTFSWNEPSTVQLEATHNLTNWTAVARFFGSPPSTTWTTNMPLEDHGKFFRLSLVANRHLTNATTATATTVSAAQRFREIPIISRELVRNQIQVGFASTPGGKYEIDHLSRAGQVICTTSTVASKSFTTVSFDISTSGNAGSFRVRQPRE